jgi:acetoin utilization deacetylase AcuC-like enzyme
VACVLEQFKPELILVSTGFDAHYSDPLGGLQVSTAGIRSAASALIAAADRICDGRICFVLEGGYNLDALQGCSRAVLEVMETCEPPQDTKEGALFGMISESASASFGQWWKW